MLEYLSYVRLLSVKDKIEEAEGTIRISKNVPMAHISYVVVVFVVDPITKVHSPEDGTTCLIYVFPDIVTVRATMGICKEDYVSLIHRDVLVLPWSAICATMSYQGLCSYLYVPISGDKDIDRLSIMDMCNSPDEKHVYPRGCSTTNVGKDYVIYYHTTNDLLSVFGVEYPLVLYKGLLIGSVDPAYTIYIACSQGLVTALRVTRDDKG